MPPVNQGSRSALVGWVVTMSIVAVTSLIFAIYFYVDSARVNERLDTQTKEYGDVVSREMLKGPEIEELRAARGEGNGEKLLSVAIDQRNGLAKLITGSEDPVAAQASAANDLTKSKSVGAKPAGDSLSAAIDALVTELKARKAEADNNKKDSEASKAKLQQTVAATESQIKSLTQTMEGLRAEKDAALQQVQQITNQQREGFGQTSDQMRQTLATAQGQINELNTQVATGNAEITRLKGELDKSLQKLNDIRVDPTKAVTRQPDGQIVRVPGNNLAFINIGSGDQVTPGLTFEVYDKTEGIPPPGEPTNNDNLPIGKASIEVIRVAGPSLSECRITRLSPGAAISEGDLVANLVFDRNTKYNFVVFGNFDLDQNGVATPQDTEVIKRLITQWGGHVVNDVNVDTDFVVLGKEPVVPQKPTDINPVEQARYEAAIAEYDAYGKILDTAKQYRVPILNQNRFLYLIGYYENAKR